MVNGKKSARILSAVIAVLFSSVVNAAQVNFVSGATGNDLEIFKQLAKPWEEETGNTLNIVPMPSSTTDQFAQYRLWLAAGNEDIDVYMTDVIWAPQLAGQLEDLTDAARDVVADHFPSIIESQTVDGKLVAMPFFTDAPALYYRKDLLEKYGVEPPKTWEALAATAKKVQDGEREAGNKDFWGFVFQGNAYEGLTCDALEWVKSSGGGQIVEADGTISINNENAIKALETARGWISNITPEGVLSYTEEESRGLWQTGNAAFMRNWPYAYSLGNGDDSPIKDKFDVTILPSGGGDNKSAATLGGWNLAVSRYAKNKDAAFSFVKFMSSRETQKQSALLGSKLPTVIALYDDADIAAKQPIIPRWKDVFLQAVPRPSAPTKGKYNEVSSKFWSATHEVLSGESTAPDALEVLEAELQDIKGDAW
ncbi:MAG: ABC transporter substrate-binding protein [Thiothrix sp.]|nr:ABC transporter substrate-binding protein [Thiothrix sp.]HPQ95091.1 ABC transporter substrate-binding protein [Thiolinea sp.]